MIVPDTPHVPSAPARGADGVIYLVRLANALPRDSQRELRIGLTKFASDMNRGLPERERILMVRDPRCSEPFPGASPDELVTASYVAIGHYLEAPAQAEKTSNRMAAYLMLERYFVWCRAMAEEAMRRGNQSEGETKPDSLAHSLDIPELKVGAFLAHWIAALCPVIEGWEELGLADKEIDALLQEGRDNEYTKRLQRFRNGIFHYQVRFDDPRFTDFMDDKGDARVWMITLERAFDRFFREQAATEYTGLNTWLER